MEDVVEAAEEAAATELNADIVRPTTQPKRAVLLYRRDYVVCRSMRLCMP